MHHLPLAPVVLWKPFRRLYIRARSARAQEQASAREVVRMMLGKPWIERIDGEGQGELALFSEGAISGTDKCRSSNPLLRTTSIGCRQAGQWNPVGLGAASCKVDGYARVVCGCLQACSRLSSVSSHCSAPCPRFAMFVCLVRPLCLDPLCLARLPCPCLFCTSSIAVDGPEVHFLRKMYLCGPLYQVKNILQDAMSSRFGFRCNHLLLHCFGNTSSFLARLLIYRYLIQPPLPELPSVHGKPILSFPMFSASQVIPICLSIR